MQYSVKHPEDLSDKEVGLILKSWEIKSWLGLDAAGFRLKFKDSEFHFLEIDDKVVSLARINFDFKLEIQGKSHCFAELVGLVSLEKAKGYARILLREIFTDLSERQIQTIGFCKSELRPFYEKNNIRILYGKGSFITEFDSHQWIDSDDDDILLVNISEENLTILQNLSERNKAVFDRSGY